MFKNLFLLLLIINLFACTSSQVKNDIIENDWQSLGEEQAAKGGNEHTLGELKALSDKYGNGVVDYPAYQLGYQKALIIYCQPHHAIELGLLGKPYNGICDRFPHGDKFNEDWELTERANKGGM